MYKNKKMRYGWDIILLSMFLFFTSVICLPAHAERPEKENILLIFSWEKNSRWNMEIEKGFNLEYEKFSSKPNVFYEYMDAGRFKNQDQVHIFNDYLQKKYAAHSMDSVVFESPPAARLLISYPDIFEHSQKYVLNPGPLESELPSGKSAVIPVNTDYKSSVDAMLQASKGKTIYLVTSATEDGKKRIELVSGLIAENEPDRKVVSLIDLSMDELLDRVSNLQNENSVIFFMPYFKDANGVSYVPYEAARQISQRSGAQVYTAWSVFMGTGVVGGYLLSGEMVGRMLASMLANQPQTASMNSKQFKDKLHGFFFDWRQLGRWNIQENSLPLGSEILLKKPIFFEIYFKEIITGSLSIAFLISFLWIFRLRKEIKVRRVVERNLQESEIRFRSLSDAAFEGIILSNKGVIMDASHAAKEMFGYSHNEMLGMKITNLIARENKENVHNRILSENEKSYEFLGVKKDGTEFQLEAHAKMYTNMNKQGIVTALRDLTEKKKTEEERLDSDKKLQLLFDNSPMGICTVDLLGNFVMTNSAYEQMLGYSKEELRDLSFFDITHPDYRPKNKKLFQKMFSLKSTEFFFEKIYIRKDGAEINVSVNANAVMDNKGNPRFGTAFVKDITGRKQAEKKLKYLERRNQALLDYSPVCHKIIDLDFNLQYMSANGFKMMKLDANARVYGNPYPFGFFPASFRNKMIESLEKVKNTGKNITMEALTNDIEGNEIWLESTLIPVFDDGGKIEYLTVVSADTTLRKEDEKVKHGLEKQLHQSQKLEAIGNLAGGIAHDFNNILSSILGFTQLGLDQVEKNTEFEDDLQEVLNAGNRAKDLVKQILAFARKSEEETKPLQPSIIIEEVLKFIRSSIPSSIEIIQTINSDSFIKGNPTQIHQILMNLCTNAAHAMEDHGGLLELNIKDISIESDQRKETIDLKPGEYIQISVSDTGTGIPDEIINSIFDPYFTTKSLGEGTGMGLSVVHGIVETYGGKITVVSKPGLGSTFRIYLPITKKRKLGSTYTSENLPTGSEKILYIDDEPPIAKMGKRTLEQLGYLVETRTDSLDALEFFRSKPDDFDLVITDMTMPNMTGDVLASELMSIRPDIPVILCTGFSKKISDESATKIGIKIFMNKPFVKADLAQTIRKVLDEVQD